MDIFEKLKTNQKTQYFLKQILGEDIVSQMMSGTLNEESKKIVLEEMKTVICDHNVCIWEGESYNPHNEEDLEQIYPASIYEYEGIFWYNRLEYDDSDYFESFEETFNALESEIGESSFCLREVTPWVKGKSTDRKDIPINPPYGGYSYPPRVELKEVHQPPDTYNSTSEIRNSTSDSKSPSETSNKPKYYKNTKEAIRERLGVGLYLQTILEEEEAEKKLKNSLKKEDSL